MQGDRECKRKGLERTLTAEIGNPVKADIAAPPSNVRQIEPLATQPDSFPAPVIGAAWIRRLPVRVNGGLEVNRVLVTATGALYEIGTTMKKALFGMVILAMELKPSPEYNPGKNGPDDAFLRTDELRAIKIYSKRQLRASHGQTSEDPMMEIAALQFIGDSHPNIMGQIECCADQDNIYSVMRYCPGGELFDVVLGQGPLEMPLARSMFRQNLGALKILQELGIAHRDMSLENMLFDGTNLFVVIDFGMCLRLKRDPVTGQFCKLFKQSVCGKNNYIAPEVMRGDDTFDPRLCDIWAAGVMLFIALTGCPPVDSASENDARFKLICEGRLQEMVDAWRLPFEVDAQALDLIQQILRPNPEDRPTIEQILQHPWLCTDEPAPAFAPAL